MTIRILTCLVLVLHTSGTFAKACGKGHIAGSKECHIDKPPEPKEHKGKLCGNTYIAHDKECHIGQVAPEKPPVITTPQIKAAPEKPKISPAIIAAPIVAAAATAAVISQAQKPNQENTPFTPFISALGLLLFWGHARKVKKTTF